jgi:hypothetical protein
VFAPSNQSTNALSNRVIAVEANRGGFVVKVPTDVERTPEGDLDFSRSDSGRLGEFTWFEFDRVVLGLSHAPKSRRFARLLNLARFAGFRDVPRSREMFDQLITDSGIPTSQREMLLAAFDEQSARTR